MTTVRIGVISDTHLSGDRRPLPARIVDVFDGVEQILHAGDLVDARVLDDLEAIAPTRAVLGNMDSGGLSALLPQDLLVASGGIKIGMVHDSGASGGRRRRLRNAFPECRVVVFGHSHQPLIDDDGELMLLNPGSACYPRAARVPTVAILEIEEARPRAELIELR